jgi:hypothetical protein
LRFAFVVGVALVACGGGKPPPKAAAVATKESASPPRKPEAPKAQPYAPGALPSDVGSPFVKGERSSRLGVPLPKGKAREAWTAEIDPKTDPAFLLTAGTRIVVVGRKGRYAIVDTKGFSVASGSLDGERVDRARVDAEAGTLANGGTKLVSLGDGSESDVLPTERSAAPDLPPSAHAATHGDATIYANGNALEVKDPDGVRQIIQGAFDILDIAVDDEGVAYAIIKQGKKGELSLWITPIRGGSIGRVKLPAGKRERLAVPPIVGKAVRIFVYDDRVVGMAPEGKTLWEKRGALTGGATLTADDRLLVASDDKVQILESASGKSIDTAQAKGVVLLTPPILVSTMLVVASGSKLHAFTFD